MESVSDDREQKYDDGGCVKFNVSELHVYYLVLYFLLFFFFFNDTATTEIYTLSLHDALPI